MKNFCSHCGEKLNPNQNFCSSCGTFLHSNIKTNKEKNASVGLILGLISIVAWIIPLFGFPITICAIVFSAQGFSSEGRTKSIVGLVLAVIFFFLTLLNSILGLMITGY